MGLDTQYKAHEVERTALSGCDIGRCSLQQGLMSLLL